MTDKIIGIETNPYMQAPPTSRFAVPMTSRPLINVRQEFLATKRWFEDAAGGETDPEIDLTNVVQHSILGLESYLQSAANMAVILTSTDKETRQRKLARLSDEPMMGARSWVNALYVRVPDLAIEGAGLNRYDDQLYKDTKEMYAVLRNPLFHGASISTEDSTALLPVYDLIAVLYDWLDAWYPIDDILAATNKPESGLQIRWPKITGVKSEDL